MSPDQDSDELQRIRAYLNARLDSFVRRTSLHLPTGIEGSGNIGPRGHNPQVGPLTALQGSGPTATPASNRINLKGMKAFQDNERSVRALAKEIKHLITEDMKRGIGFGV